MVAHNIKRFLLIAFLCQGILFVQAQEYLDLYRDAVEAAEKGQYEEAQIWLQQALELKPKDIDILMALGTVMMLKDKDFTARKYFNQIIKFSKDTLELSNAYLKRGRLYFYRNDFRESLSDLNKALKHNSGNALIYAYMADNYFYMMKTPKAIEYFDKAINMDPTCYECYILRGKMHAGLNQYEAAEKDFNQAVVVGPLNRSLAYFERGILYYYQEKYRHAIRDLNAAEEFMFKENLGELLSFRGEAYYFVKEYELAIKDMETVLKKDTLHQKENLYRIALSYMELGQYDAASDYFMKYIRVAPNDPNGYNYLGMTEIYRNNFVGAEKAFFKSREINKFHFMVYNNIGILRLRQKDFIAAEEVLTHSISLLQEGLEDGEPFFYRSIARIKLEQKELACQDLASARDFGFDEQLIMEVWNNECVD